MTAGRNDNRTMRQQLEQVEMALRESEERLRLALEAAQMGTWEWDVPANAVHWSHTASIIPDMVSEPPGNTYETFLSCVHPEDRPRVMQAVQEALAEPPAGSEAGQNGRYEVEFRTLPVDGDVRWVIGRGRLLRDENGRPQRLLGVSMDITERKRAEQQLLQNAFYDALTGLPNRALFLNRLQRALETGGQRRARDKSASKYRLAVLFLDVDHFKVVNESRGHFQGDELLTAVAQRLESCLRPGDTLARLGGDEFAVLVDNIRRPIDATHMAERIVRELKAPFALHEQEVFVAASIGIALGGAEPAGAEELLRDADIAMYRAKRAGRARYEIFDADMHAQAMERLQLETDLRRALEQGEFCLHYQPIVSLKSGTVTAFEALVRWRHPEQGLVPPLKFIPVAEEIGLIAALDRWVLGEACRQLRAWHDAGAVAPDSIHVNLSSHNFAQPNLAEQIIEALGECATEPGHIGLEVTESAVMENPESAAAVLKRMQALGIHLSLDDFGTGYSSLSYLHRFPFDTLKIDRSFVQKMGNAGDHAAIVRAIVTMAHTLELGVTAEGIETSEQLALLRALGCECGQGYFFARPLPAEEAAALLARRPRW